MPPAARFAQTDQVALRYQARHSVEPLCDLDVKDAASNGGLAQRRILMIQFLLAVRHAQQPPLSPPAERIRYDQRRTIAVLYPATIQLIGAALHGAVPKSGAKQRLVLPLNP